VINASIRSKSDQIDVMIKRFSPLRCRGVTLPATILRG
jgi:hypothetical protein